MSKSSDAWARFHGQMVFWDVFENGKKRSKRGLFDEFYHEWGDNTELTLIVARMHPKFDYLKSERQSDVNEQLLEQDALRIILKKRVVKGIKKLSAKTDEKGNLIVPFDRLLVWGINFGQNIYNSHEQITKEI